MSVHVSSWAWKQKAGKAKLVLLKLADNANDEGLAWPTQKRLATECELGERTIREHIEALRALGLIEVVRAEDQRGRPAQYRFLISGENGLKPRRLAAKSAGVSGGNGRSLIGRRTVKEPERANALSSRPRREDPLWELLTAELGEPQTRSERGRRNKALKELRDVGATADEVRLRIAAYRRRWPEIELTATGLAANWSLLGSQNGSASTPEQRADARVARFEARMAREQVSA